MSQCLLVIMEEGHQLDENTVETLKMIHKELELEDAVEEDINWEDMKPMQVDPVDMILERVNSFKDRRARFGDWGKKGGTPALKPENV